MHFDQPNGKILINSKNGCTKLVSSTERNDYILPDAKACAAETSRTYSVSPKSNKSICINRYSDAISEFENIEF